MSRKLDHLVPAFRDRVEDALAEAESNRLDVLIYCTHRSPEEQARLYRQSRTRYEIDFKANKLLTAGHYELADILRGVGPQMGTIGKHVTMAGPGESFHNYGLAFDGVIMVNGKPDWACEHMEMWVIWGSILETHNIEWAGAWVRFREMVHGQDCLGMNPLKAHTPDQVKQLLDAARKYALC